MQRSRVRCEGLWYEVLDAPQNVAELLDHGDGDWVELSGAPDGRPIWLLASLVDYVAPVGREDDLEWERMQRFMNLMLEPGGARCAWGVRRHVGAWSTIRNRRRARCARCWI